MSNIVSVHQTVFLLWRILAVAHSSDPCNIFQIPAARAKHQFDVTLNARNSLNFIVGLFTSAGGSDVNAQVYPPYPCDQNIRYYGPVMESYSHVHVSRDWIYCGYSISGNILPCVWHISRIEVLQIMDQAPICSELYVLFILHIHYVSLFHLKIVWWKKQRVTICSDLESD
jgi:hypothetical protein